MSTPSRSASCRARARPHVEAEHHRVRRGRELTSFSVIPPTVWMTLTRTSGCWILPSSPRSASTEPWTSPLRTMFRSCTPPACICSKSVSSDTPPAFEALRELLAAKALGALLGDVLRLALVLDDAELTRGRRAVEAEDLHGLARPRLLDLLAAIVVERADLARGVARDDRVADPQRAALDEHRRDGPRPTSSRDSMIGPDASAFAFARRSSSASATSSTFSSSSSRFVCCLAETSANCVVRPSPRAAALRRRARSSRGRGSRRARRSC